MFEFLYAKKVKSEELVNIINENLDKYYIHINFKENGGAEVFIGNRRDDNKKEEQREGN